MYIVIVLNARGQWVEWSSCKTNPDKREVRLYDEGSALSLALSLSISHGQYAQYTTLSHLLSLNNN